VLEAYFPILIFIAFGVFIGIAPIILGYFLAPRRPDKEKLSTYECGFPPAQVSHMPFDVRYYLVAILFILFDLEVAFLVPWAVVFRQLGWQGMVAMLIFIGLLVLGFIYEWRRGALEWD